MHIMQVFVSFLRNILLGFMRRKSLYLCCFKDKLNIKKKININFEKKTWGACPPQTTEDDQSHCIFSLECITYVEGVFSCSISSFTVKIWQKSFQQAFSAAGFFTTNLSTRDAFVSNSMKEVTFCVVVNIAWIVVVEIHLQFWLVQAKKGIVCIAPIGNFLRMKTCTSIAPVIWLNVGSQTAVYWNSLKTL